jgi:tetratricopeptide (TPR) repeat protein
MSEVLALVASRRWKEADGLFLSIYSHWQDDPRFPAVSAAIGLARGDLDGAEAWLSSTSEVVPKRLRHPLVRRLWSGDMGPGLAEALEAEFPSEWPDLVSTALSAELRFYVLLWQKRYAEARDYTARMILLLRRMELPEGRWVARAGDAAFYDGDYLDALARYEETLKLSPDPAPIYLKLSDVHFMMGDLERERVYREKIYGSLRPE